MWTAEKDFAPLGLSKGQATRIRIIEAATRLFMSQGLYSVTMAEIGRQVGMTHAAVYRHFKDMDELILASCLHWINDFRNQDQVEIQKGREQLKNYIERHFKYSTKNRSHDGLLLGLYYYSMRSPKMLKVYREIKEGGISRITNIIKQGNLDGSWKVQQVGDLAKSVHSILIGELLKLIIEPHDESVTERSLRVYKFILGLLR